MDREEKAVELTKAACMLMNLKANSAEDAARWTVSIFECVLAELEKTKEERFAFLKVDSELLK